MTKQETITASDEAWEEGQLGNDEEFVRVSQGDQSDLQLDESLQMQMISIRLPKSLIEDFKNLASIHKVGYQPLMRDILNRWADSEKKHILAEFRCQLDRERREDEERELEPRKAG